MDPFTQRIFEKAEQRSKNLGISKTAKIPFSGNNSVESSGDSLNQITVVKKGRNDKSPSAASKESLQSQKLQVLQRKVEIENSNNKTSPSKVHRLFSVDKENMDIQINITTGSNFDVQVEVEEQDVDENVKSLKIMEKPDKNLNKIRDSSRNRLQRLGALYSNTDDLSSPIHRTEGKFHADDGTLAVSSSRKITKLNKLAALASSISSWEDDTSHPDYRKMKNTELIMSPRKDKNNESIMSPRNDKKNESIKQDKKLKWDQNVMDSLEAQGFERRQSSTTKLSYNYNKEDQQILNKNCGKIVKEKLKIPQIQNAKTKQTELVCVGEKSKNDKLQAVPNNSSKNMKSGFVSGRTAAFETKANKNLQQQNITKKSQKDPAEMSLKERMQLFEKNKGEALIPKAPFASAIPANKIVSDDKNIEKLNQPIKTKPQLAGNVVNIRENNFSTLSEQKIKNDILKQKQQDLEVIAQRYAKVESSVASIKNAEYNSEILKVTSNSLAPLKTTMAPPPPPPLPALKNNNNNSNKRSSPSNTTERNEDGNKKLKLNSNRLYPALSDLELSSLENDDNCTTATLYSEEEYKKTYCEHLSSSSAMEDEEDMEENDSILESDVSLGHEIMKQVQRNDNKKIIRKGVHYADLDTYDSSVNTSENSANMDDYLEEALDDDSDDEIMNINNKVGTKSSSSFSYKKTPRKYDNYNSIKEENENEEKISSSVAQQQPVTSELTVNQSDNNDKVTLVHTVSFYRKQQSSNSANNTPIRKVTHEYKERKVDTNEEHEYFVEEDDEAKSGLVQSIENSSYLVNEKIKKLLDEVMKQQQVISQTSTALNLCAATIEFSGSSESVEGERHLLVATHRRQAALDEVQRLRVEGSVRPQGAPKEKGRLTVNEIILPLRQDYIRKLSSDAISGHHIVCLLKYNEIVLATKTVPTLPGLLAVKFPDVLTLNEVFADFRITMEVYGMTAQREILPHEVKYHINLNKKSGARTPKKKASDSRLFMPMIQSPAGPNAVRTPALIQYGYAIFSLREIQKKSWTLTQVSGFSPLDGIINMKVQCELSVSVEYKGFLNMFEEISGFGAWRRRWCYLNGNVLNYWTYPNEEKKQAPMGSIDLNTCSSTRITTAPREICARMNTILLECQRPSKESDAESLIMIPKGKITTIRYLLSADTKEDRDEWCAYFNKALTLLRAWGTAH